jgi:hypothetical protein
MQVQNAFYALFLGIDKAARDHGSTESEVLNAIRNSNIDSHPFMLKIKKMLLANFDRFGVTRTSKDYFLPIGLLSKLKEDDTSIRIKSAKDFTGPRRPKITPKLK